MKRRISCRVCNEEGVCRDDLSREDMLHTWMEPFVDHYQLDLSGLLGFMFTPKLALSQYGAEFLRRKNGQSYILISEEMWENAQTRLMDLRIMQNTLQHELAHVHNNNSLQTLAGKMIYIVEENRIDWSFMMFRFWDEFFAAQLAAASEPSGLLQSKMTGILTEARLLARTMNGFHSERHREREQHMQSLFLACMYLAGSYSGNEELRRAILEGSLRKTVFVRTICEVAETGERMLQTYPFTHYRAMLPLAEAYLHFCQEMDRTYRPLWRRIVSPQKSGKLMAFD